MREKPGPVARLSVILATPPGFDAGAIATELALTAFLGRHELQSDARCYQLTGYDERPARAPQARADAGAAYPSAFEHADAIAASDAVLFWADFLRAGSTFRPTEHAAARSPKDALLLAGADDATIGRAISFGTTLLGNTLRDDADASCAFALQRFITHAKRVWVRDVLSAAKVAHMRRDYATSAFGVDCAQLLTRDDVLHGAAARGLAPPRQPHSVLALFQHEADCYDELVEVATALGSALGRPVQRLASNGAGAASAHALLNQIAHAALVVTDSYHLALVAWTAGVPAVGASTGHDELDVFFSQYGAPDFLIRPDELREPAMLRQRTRHLAHAVQDGWLVRAIASRMRVHAESVETALAHDLAELLGRPRAHASAGVRAASVSGLSARKARPFKAVAVMCVADEEIHIQSALRDLIDEGLDVVLIDHDSGDRTVELAQPFLGHGLLSIERLPWTGSFSVTEQLEAKWRIIDQVDHDWIVHADADEWLSAPAAGQTLLDGLRTADAAGANAVHFNEFVFVPRPGEDVYAPDYRTRSWQYYFYRPQYPYLLRAWKHRSGLDNRAFGGHLLTGPVRQYPLDFPMRHYIVLSEAHARRKYLGRAYAKREVSRGFHGDRIGLTRDDLRFPRAGDPHVRMLAHWASKEFDVADPATEHFWHWRKRSRTAVSARA